MVLQNPFSSFTAQFRITLHYNISYIPQIVGLIAPLARTCVPDTRTGGYHLWYSFLVRPHIPVLHRDDMIIGTVVVCVLVGAMMQLTQAKEATIRSMYVFGSSQINLSKVP